MQIEKSEQELLLELAQVCTRPGSWVLQEYETPDKKYTNIEAAIASQKHLLVVAPEHLLVIDADAKYFDADSKQEQIKCIDFQGTLDPGYGTIGCKSLLRKNWYASSASTNWLLQERQPILS